MLVMLVMVARQQRADDSQQRADVLYGAASKGDKAAFAQLIALGNKGNAYAQLHLYGMYGGDGVPKDDVPSAFWLRKSAEQGNARAQELMGLKYFHGDGVPKNRVLSYMWANLAAAQGAYHAQQTRETLEDGRMTPAQIAEGQRLSREWKPKP